MHQQTINKSVSYTGKTIFSGIETTINLKPAPENHGITFKRVDLPGQPIIPATVENVFEVARTTVLGSKGAHLQMVEHLLATLHAYQIDNLLIEVNGIEIPAGDGSAKIYVDLIEKAQVLKQEAKSKVCSLSQVVYCADNEVQLVALPSDTLQLSFTLSYPNHSILRSQFFSYQVDPKTFELEIAPARTFALYEEVLFLQNKGLLKGTGLDRAVVIKGDEILNPEGLRFPEEMARHKILDLLGDMKLVGRPFTAHIIAIRSGHATNIALAKKIQHALQ